MAVSYLPPVERILAMDIGDRITVERGDVAATREFLATGPFNGMRFLPYENPSGRVTFIRLYDDPSRSLVQDMELRSRVMAFNKAALAQLDRAIIAELQELLKAGKVNDEVGLHVTGS